MTFRAHCRSWDRSTRRHRAFVEACHQSLGRVVNLAEGPPAFLIARPGDVTRSLAVACLAANADLRKSRGKSVVHRIVILAHAGRVALRAHEVPVLVQLCPMQNVIVPDLLVRIEMEPALAAFVLRPAVPGDRQRLQPAVGKLDQILLQRIDAERVLHLERGKLAVGPVGLDQKLAVLAEEAGAHAVIVETRVGEIAEHRLVVAWCIACWCCEARHSALRVRWQPAQVSLPTKVGARGGSAGTYRASLRS